MASSKDSDQLTLNQIVRLASSISANNMAVIAEGFMGISPETIKNIKRDVRNSETFNREILRIWTNMNPSNQIQRLTSLLYSAAREYRYVHPRKVEDILGVSRQNLEHLDSGPNETEFRALGETLRPYTEQAMKMEVAPWIRDYVSNMEDVYEELSLVKLGKTPSGPPQRILDDYKAMFKSKISLKPQNANKILLVSDPGYGKTSIAKKINWDWAKGVFTTFTVIFIVFLKFVRPGDAIENVIIQQTPALEGMGVSSLRLKRILETFADKCLIILDGVDEHALGSNNDVLAIIRGVKFHKCGIIATSRPHSSREIERYFPMVVNIQGFTRSSAHKFASKLLSDPERIEAVLQFSSYPSEEYKPWYQCPILLSFLCLLVRDVDINLNENVIPLGEVYTRLLRCLYRKFTLRKGIEYQDMDFTRMLQTVGKIALKTLKLGNLMTRRETIRELGGDAFNYGLIIGHEKVGISGDESGDISITFLEKGMQAFLGAFYFTRMLDNGKSFEWLLGHDQEHPVITSIPLFLQFCLWLLKNSEHYFFFENTEHVGQRLQDFITEQLVKHKKVRDLPSLCFVLEFPYDALEQDQLTKTFFEDTIYLLNKLGETDERATTQLSTEDEGQKGETSVSRNIYASMEIRKGVHSEVDKFQSTESSATYKRPELEGEVHDKGNEITNCPVCLDVYREPKLLSCTHTVCLRCLENLSKDKRHFLCPECRTEHTVGNNGVIGSREDQTMMQLVEKSWETDVLKWKLQSMNVDRSPPNIPPLTALTKRVLKHRVQIVEIIHGSAVTIQALHSDVILHVPDGVYGIILGNIHTDHWRFRHLVPEKDCIIGPICDYHLIRFDATRDEENIRFRIQVPHILKGYDLDEGEIKVKRVHKEVTWNAIRFSHRQDPEEVYYKYNYKYVEIFTREFSKYIIYAKGIRHCCGSAAIVAFSKMTWDDAGPIATVTAYLCSLHHVHGDYRQKLKEIHGTEDNGEFEELPLSKKQYDAAKSKIEVACLTHTLDTQKQRQERWRRYQDTPLQKVMTLDEAFKYDGQHICKSIPTQLKFRLGATEASDQYTVDMTVKVKVKAKGRASMFRKVEEERDPVRLKLYPLYISEAVDRNYGRELTDSMVWNLSCRMTNEPDLCMLATNGLRVEEHIVDEAINRPTTTIPLAAQEILKIWRRGQANSRLAHSRLCDILKEEAVGMNMLVRTVLNG